MANDKKTTTKKGPTSKAPASTGSVNTNIKKGYIDKNSQYNADLINKAQAYMTGGTYIAGKPVDTNYWSTAGGGGKNTLYGNTGEKSYVGTGFTDKDFAAIQDYVNQYEANQAAQKAAQEAAQREAEYAQMAQTYIQPYVSQIESGLAQNQAALQNAQKLSADQINNAYDLSARDYYQLYKTQQAKLPENLSKAGVTGGASESAQLKLMNNYSENLYKNEAARNNQLAGVNADYNNQIAQNSINAANQMANAYLQMAQQQLSYKRQDELAAKEQQAQAELQAQQNALTIKNNETRGREAKRQAEGYKTVHWTDENGVYHYRLAGQNSKTGSGKKRSPSSSKVKATSSSGSSGTYSAVTNNAPVANASSGVSYDDVLKQARLRLSRPAFENNRITNTLNGAQGALNYIRNSGLSYAQQKKMAQQLGLI